ncbi:MAG: LacI family DNA-binding transcriptional regulator [Armatimonadota bacterium]
MTTIRQIARIAGVSIGTVSKALRDNPRLRPETRARIQEIAAELHYYPNRLAHGALLGRSRAIGLLVPEIQQPYNARMLAYILKEAEQADYHVIVREFLYREDLLRLGLAYLIEQRVEGIICAPVYQEAVLLDSLTALRSLGIPVVAVDMVRYPSPIDNIITDQQQAAIVITEYLMDFGHRHFALVGGMPHVRFQTTIGHAVLEALRARHMSVCHLGDRESETFDAAYARAVLTETLAASPPPTALICWSEWIAGRLAYQTSLLGVHIPQDLSLVACSNTVVSDYTVPPLTSLELHEAEKGARAVRLLLRRLSELPDATAPPEFITIPASIIERESCARPRTAAHVGNR